jgi:DNA-directed RNA polymerase subunit alpha
MIPLPSKPKIILDEGDRAVFEIEGLYPGYGQTLGNSIRRVLLSSLRGGAITSVKIEGVGHEFSTIEGVMEDVVEIILNLKQLRFRLHEEGPLTVTLSAKGEKEVVGKDVKVPSRAELVTPNVHIATLTGKKSVLNLEAMVESGLGYVPIEAQTKEKVEVGTIGLDAAFSPVRHVNYEVENMRVGDRTDYNRLRLDITTDGSLTPREAFENAVKILLAQLETMVEGFEEEIPAEGVIETGFGQERGEGEEEEGEERETESEEVLKIKLNDVKLSSRTLNVLREAGIKTIGGLSRKREKTLKGISGLGEKGFQEIKKALGMLGITLKP